MKNGVIIIRSDGSEAEPAQAAIQVIRDGEIVHTKVLDDLQFHVETSDDAVVALQVIYGD